jgi:hypothetical protein
MPQKRFSHKEHKIPKKVMPILSLCASLWQKTGASTRVLAGEHLCLRAHC